MLLNSRQRPGFPSTNSRQLAGLDQRPVVDIRSRGASLAAPNLNKNTSGGCWIRTNVGNAGRFTACSLWPLGQPSEVDAEDRASGGTRTPNRLFTKQVLCQLSYASRERTPARTPRKAARGGGRRKGEASSVHRQVRRWARSGLLDRTARAPKKRGTPPFSLPPNSGRGEKVRRGSTRTGAS